MRNKGTSSFPSSRPPAATDRLTGAVTWFSASKGFGFIKPADGTEDVFVHVSVVQRAGLDGLREGATVTCEVAPGKKGRQVVRLLDVNDETAVAPDAGHGGEHGGGEHGGFRPRPPRPFGGAGGSYGAPQPAGEPGEGTVKWFNATKGFGFITPDTGGKDVFLHASVVRRAGLMEVQPGQRVRYTAVEREKGPEARTLEMTQGGGPSGGDAPSY
ncbi:MAG: CspA family cold shock protein [Alphaproteobacteria bacterium]|nr:CspA family cold shock protein [Alphaproteobacteria bacterium]